MQVAFIAIIVLHGLIHLLGFAKAFRLAELPELKQPVGRPAGVGWLAAAVFFVFTAVLWRLGSAGAGICALAAAALSQALILGAWRDARWGTVPNVLVAVYVALGA